MTTYIVSVGTSLIGWCNHNKKDRIPFKNGIPIKETDWREGSDNGYDYRGTLMSLCLNKNERSIASAELSSLLKDDILKPKSGDSIFLVHTNTLMATACAEFINKEMVKQGYQHIELKPLHGMSDVSGSDFYKKGLPNLIHTLVELINNAQPEFVLVPTGGYKAIIPYFVLIGILYKIPCRYIYEDSNNVIELPPLPLHADLSQWTGLEAILESLEKKGYTAIDEWSLPRKAGIIGMIHNLLIEDEDNLLKKSPLCDLLEKRVQEDRRRSELQFKTLNSPLLHYLVEDNKDNPDKSLRDMFLRIAEIGPNIWKGDRVPEMADHALRHHADLFHLAERILLPIFFHYEINLRKPFLSPEELFVLMGALHFHDCGHVLGSITLDDGKKLRLFPMEIRDHHHVLGYLRLMEADKHGGTGKVIHDKLFNQSLSEENKQLLQNLLKAIAVIGLYHRKKMLLEKNDFSWDFFGQKSKPYLLSLKEHLATEPLCVNDVNDKPIDYDRASLLVALLRIIDGLDEQASRTGGPDEIAFHLSQLETEAVEEKHRSDSLGKSLTALGLMTGIEEIINGAVKNFIEKEGKGYEKESLKAFESLDENTFRKIYQCLIEQHPEHEGLIFEYACASFRSYFKDFQKIPYGEKAFVDQIIIQNQIVNTKIHFTINLEMASPERINDMAAAMECDHIEKDGKCFYLKASCGIDGFRSYMLSELEKEYTAENGFIKKILDDNHIVLNYAK
jgi:putative CRISPR-associated protein (TIGR02619 family)